MNHDWLAKRFIDNSNDVFVWLRADDYKTFMHKNHPDVSLVNDNKYDIIYTGNHKELYANKNAVQTSMIDALYTLHKMYGENGSIEVHVVGSDYIYEPGNTHFYKQAGTRDPLRGGKENLLRELHQLQKYYMNSNSKLYNVGNQEKTLLPFQRKKLI